jgi:hypothetical protein
LGKMDLGSESESESEPEDEEEDEEDEEDEADELDAILLAGLAGCSSSLEPSDEEDDPVEYETSLLLLFLAFLLLPEAIPAGGLDIIAEDVCPTQTWKYLPKMETPQTMLIPKCHIRDYTRRN